ncbi:MAG TPA: hypothetical protein VMF89_24285, partial [Polyangiales bacterium]|nr:hypothetical protein [Polyangiales bacterium]
DVALPVPHLLERWCWVCQLTHSIAIVEGLDWFAVRLEVLTLCFMLNDLVEASVRRIRSEIRADLLWRRIGAGDLDRRRSFSSN